MEHSCFFFIRGYLLRYNIYMNEMRMSKYQYNMNGHMQCVKAIAVNDDYHNEALCFEREGLIK